METLEYIPQDGNVDEQDITTFHDTKQEETEYKEVFVQSFTQAVDTIEKEQIFNDKDFNICLLDIDGVLFKDNMVKLPIVSHFSDTEISERTKKAYNRLVSITKGNLVISTNRGEKEKLIFNSGKVLNQVKQLVKSNGNNTPIFTGLFKQKPGLTTENIANIYQNPSMKSEKRVTKPKIDALVHYIGKLATEKDHQKYSITCIEDWSIVSLNRKDFLLYVSDQLKQLYGIEIEEIRNYVIKR